MLIKKRNILFWIICALFCVISCKKTETTFPQVTITRPFNNTSLKVGDVVTVEGEVQDPTLRKVEMTLVNANFIPVLSSTNIPVTSTDMSFKRELVIDNLDLETGTYHIRVRAWNDGEVASGFKQVSVQGIPKVRLGTLIGSEDGGNMNVNFYRDNGTTESLLNYSGDLFGLRSWNGNRVSASVPSYKGTISFLDNISGNPEYSQSVTPAPGGNPNITGFGLVEKGFALMNFNGAVDVKNKLGSNTAILILSDGYFGEFIVEIGNNWMIISNKVGTGKRVYKYSSLTQQLLSTFPIGNEKIIYADAHQNRVVLVEENGIIRTIDLSGVNQIVKVIANETVFSAVIISESRLALALSNGLHVLDLNSGDLTLVANVSIKPTELSFDSLNNELNLSEGANFESRDVTNWALKRVITASGNIEKHETVYNR